MCESLRKHFNNKVENVLPPIEGKGLVKSICQYCQLLTAHDVLKPEISLFFFCSRYLLPPFYTRQVINLVDKF